MDTIKRVSQWLLPLFCIVLFLTAVNSEHLSSVRATKSLVWFKGQAAERWQVIRESTKSLTWETYSPENKNIVFFMTGISLYVFCRKVPFLYNWLSFLAVLSHELVHLSVAALFGGKPLLMEVSSEEGGAAHSTKSNCMVRLSPYVVPLFTGVFLGFSGLFSKDYRWAAILLAGLFYGNYVLTTFDSLRRSQPDIERSGGRIIALPVIFVLNIVVLAGIGHIVKGL